MSDSVPEPLGGRRSLLEPYAIRLLSQYGVAFPEHCFVNSAADVAAAAEALGFPLVIKVVSEDIVHKSDVGGVVIGIQDVVSAVAAAEGIAAAVAATSRPPRVFGYLVCRHAAPGHDVIVGGVRDSTFGPAVMVGMGGVFAELLRDVSFRLAPVNVPQALAMLAEIKGYPILRGARGGEASDIEKLAELVVSVSRLLVDREDVVEIDVNPARASADACLALDARVLIDPAVPAREIACE